MELDDALIARFMGTAIKDREINNFLGFLEGLIIDNTINESELKALQGWMESNPSVYCQFPFDYLLDLLGKSFADGSGLDDIKRKRFVDVLKHFTSKKYYAGNTADMQRMHGVLAGVVCDGTIIPDEARALNNWLKDHDYLEDQAFYQDIYAMLRPVRVKRDQLTEKDSEALLREIRKYVDVDKFGMLRDCVDHHDNPDFYCGEVDIINSVFCFTGASTRYSKKEWKAVVEKSGAKFTDDLTMSVQYLVICNKGNKAWAHKSYGRKFEQAKKWQADGYPIAILTEDDFVRELGLSE